MTLFWISCMCSSLAGNTSKWRSLVVSIMKLKSPTSVWTCQKWFKLREMVYNNNYNKKNFITHLKGFSSSTSSLPLVTGPFNSFSRTLKGVSIYPWVARSIYSKMSCSGTQVSQPGFEPTLYWTETLELEFGVQSYPLGHDTPCMLPCDLECHGRVVKSIEFKCWC